MVKAAYVDLDKVKKNQGASTLTMQLASMMLGEHEKSISRKWAEIIITLQLEQRLSKEEIFAYYANDYHLGAHGSFQIYGFGEAAEAYFAKDLGQINLPEAAALAGMIQRPSAFNPYRHPDRLKDRRNVVLGLMRTNGYISDRDYALATEAPIAVAHGAAQSTEAPYYVDLVGEELQTSFRTRNFNPTPRAFTPRSICACSAPQPMLSAQACRTWTSRSASSAASADRRRPNRKWRSSRSIPTPAPCVRSPEAADYGASQLDHILAKRQPGRSSSHSSTPLPSIRPSMAVRTF